MATFVQDIFRSEGKRKQLEQKMRAVGLPDFETPESVSRQQERMVRRLDRRGLLDDHMEMKTCAGVCELPGLCSAACWVKRREYRAYLIPEATRLMFGYSKYVHTVSVVHPRYQVAPGKLSQFSLGAFKQQLARRLKKLERSIGKRVVAIGAIELTLDVELDGTTVWSPHAHLVVWGNVTKKQFRKALLPSKKFRHPREKLVVVKPALAPGRALGYATKRHPQLRQAYKSEKNGRQHRRKVKLPTSALNEHDTWLLSVPRDEPFFLHGIRHVHEKLTILRRRKVTSAKAKERA